jgi:HK97 family phage portal protein
MANITVFAAIQNALVTRAVPDGLQRPLDRGRWWQSLVREPFAGAWQRNITQTRESVLAFGAVYACVTLIASDIAKIRIRLVEQDKNGIWSEVDVPAFSPVLAKPNNWQNRIKFFEQWVISKLLAGNAYILKERDQRGVVVGLYVLDPSKVKALVAPNGDVYYEIRKDNLSGVESDTITIPASEIIHDTMVALYHPLCGVSPLSACGLAATHGLTIQENSQRFFRNDSTPGGILTAPGAIDKDTAERIKEHWESNMTGENRARVAVMGDGMKYEKMSMTATEAQMIDLLKWDETNVCTAFHVPPYMIGVGPAPAYNNIEALNQQYYTQCLQTHIESIELCLDEGLGLTAHQAHTYGTEFDLDDLLRMDTATQYKTIGDGIGAGLLAPNEGRKKIGQKPVKGGDTPYLQQQNFSLAALDRRDQSDDPFALAPKRDQNTPTSAQQDAAAAAVDATASPPPAKSFDDEIGTAAQHQIANWALKDALELQLRKMAA